MKANIFFELYNEPYLDQIETTSTSSSNYTSYSDYDNSFNMYINGSAYVTNYDIKDQKNGYEYAVVGMGTLYNVIRQTNSCYNVILLGGAENYAYFDESKYIEYGYSYTDTTGETITIPNNFISNDSSGCYNCWTLLNGAVIAGSIPQVDNSGNLISPTTYYDANSGGLENVLANLHEYSNDYGKFPGYMYNTSNNSTSTSPNESSTKS